MAYPFPADVALAISKKYAECCLVTAQRLNIPQFVHPQAVPLAAGRRLRVAYVSSDLGNHPLSHLMGSVFGGHDRRKVGFSILRSVIIRFRSCPVSLCRTIYFKSIKSYHHLMA